MNNFEKCCKTHIFLQKSVPIQPKTSNILPGKPPVSGIAAIAARAARPVREAPQQNSLDRFAIPSNARLNSTKLPNPWLT